MTDVLIHGFHPRDAPGDEVGERVAWATYDAAQRLYRARPDLSFSVVDLRDESSWPAQRRLRRALGRALDLSDAPILEIGERLYPGSVLDRSIAPETGSWDGFLAWPGQTLEYMRRIDREIDTLNLSMVMDPAWTTAPLDFRAGWARFREDWKAFYKRNDGFLHRTCADVYDDTTVYEQHLKEWRERWVKLGGKPSAPASPEANHSLSLPSLPSLEGIGGSALALSALVAVIAGIYLAGRFTR